MSVYVNFAACFYEFNSLHSVNAFDYCQRVYSLGTDGLGFLAANSSSSLGHLTVDAYITKKLMSYCDNLKWHEIFPLDLRKI